MKDELSWTDYLVEHREYGIGPLWLSQIKRIVKNQCKRRVPGEYGFTSWENDLDDMVNEVIVHRLVGLKQINYICDVSTDFDHAMGLLNNEVKFTFSKLRANSLFYALRDRLFEELHKLGWTPEPLSDQENGLKLEVSVTRLLFKLPRLPNRGEFRQSPLISPENLEVGAKMLMELAPNLAAETLSAGLRQFLTKISSSISQLSIGASSEDFDGLSGERQTDFEDNYGGIRYEELENLAIEMLSKFSAIEIECIYGVAMKENQSQIGARIGTTRQTASVKSKEALNKLEELVRNSDIDTSEQEIMISLLLKNIGVSREFLVSRGIDQNDN